jgi:aryl-alcohol dehydrogenase-like predicted oxidoreductase
MLPLCKDQGVGVIPWSPLARGRLTRDLDATTDRSENDAFGKSLYRGGGDEEIIRRVAAIAAEHGVSRAQIALAWVAKHKTVSAPIIGATKPHHLEDAIASIDVVLSADEIKQLEEPYEPQAVAGF